MHIHSEEWGVFYLVSINDHKVDLNLNIWAPQRVFVDLQRCLDHFLAQGSHIWRIVIRLARWKNVKGRFGALGK